MLKDLAAHPWPARDYRADVALVFATYVVLAYLAIVIARQPGSIATIWPANGVAIAIIASAPLSRRWGLIATVALSNLVANLLYGDTLALSLAFIPPNTLEVLAGCFLVERTKRLERFANDHDSFLRVLMAGSLLPPILGATIGAATLHTLGFATFFDVWQDWYMGAALGGVSMLPLVLALRSASFGASLERFAEPVMLMSVTVVAAATFLSLHYWEYPFVMISVALMIFAFTRPRLTTFATSAVVVMALSIVLALGWYVPSGVKSPIGHIVVFLTAALVVIPAQVVSVVVARQRSLSEMLSAVGSRIDDVIVFVDMAGVFRWVNDAHEVYSSASKDSVLGRTWSENVPSADYEANFKPMFKQARSGEMARRLVDVHYPEKGLRTIDMTMQPAYDEESHQIGVLYCGTDVTELEASRRELQRVADQLFNANRSLEQFVRISSHDLREPLNTIIQFCDLIEVDKTSQLDATGKLYFTQVRKGAARMKQMLDDVLGFVRLDDTSAVEWESVDLDQLADEVFVALTALVETTGARLSAAALGTVRGHRVLMSLLLQNLISNALKFVPPGRQPIVEVFVTRQGNEAWLSVKDNGIGIDAKHIDELGTPFRRLNSQRKFEGTGLGLAICKRIAEQLGGRIEIESVPGEGSCFSLVIADAP